MEKLKNDESDYGSGDETDPEAHNEFAETSKKHLAALAKKHANYPGEAGQEYDAELSSIFHRVLPGEGDEFAAVKPWLGAIKEPKTHPKPNKHAPTEEF